MMLSRLGAITLVMLIAEFGPSQIASAEEQPGYPPKGFEAWGVPIERTEYNAPVGNALPLPKGYREFTLIPVQTIGQSLTSEADQKLQRQALADSGVQQALGKRFIHIVTGPVEDEKGVVPTAAKAMLVRFYSYDTGNTVDVTVEPNGSVRFNAQRGLQPPETAEEIRAAQDIVLRTSTAKDALRNLIVKGILSEPQAIGLPEDQRVIYLIFNSPTNEIVHVAWVNLTTQQIAKEGPPPTER
jgi:hypothetical protein